MIIFPAIDIKDGDCVRLYKGDYTMAEVVSDSYIRTAKEFMASGAEWVHMVDLDGAKDGTQQNKDIFIDVAKNTKLKVELGGGIRDLDIAEMYLNAGISRIILGSAAVKDPEFVKVAVKEYGERIAVGIDTRNGYVALEGWFETSNIFYLDLALEMCSMGVKYFIFTDIEKDGTMEGANIEMTATLHEKLLGLGGNVIASGGIKTITDIKALRKENLYGAIIGKALYEKSINLREAIIEGNK